MDEAPKVLSPAELAVIARDLAMEAYTVEQILLRYGFDQEYYDTEVAPNPYFQRLLEDYTKE